MADLPIACSLSPDDLATRRDSLLPGLAESAVEHWPLPDGWRFVLPPSGETLSAVARTIDAERRRCRFLRFTLVVEPDGGPLSLDVTGPAGTRDFLQALVRA